MTRDKNQKLPRCGAWAWGNRTGSPRCTGAVSPPCWRLCSRFCPRCLRLRRMRLAVRGGSRSSGAPTVARRDWKIRPRARSALSLMSLRARHVIRWMSRSSSQARCGGLWTRRATAVGGPRRRGLGRSEEWVVVNEFAGRTRDPVDEQIELAGKVWRFVDTAGIRRRVHLQQGADFYASLRTQAALEKAEVAVVLLDVTVPISEQDVRIIDLVLESGRALVLAYNKWDLLDDDRRRYLEREIEQDLAHVSWAPRVNISAKTGRHLEKLVPALELALNSWDTRIPTGKFNAFLTELTQAHPHPVRGGRQPRILFGTQAATRPPAFVLFTTGFLDPGYRRYIQRRLREIYGFEGSPITVNMRVREKRERVR